MQCSTNLGALVQLVRIRACHARGQGFESPTHRQEGRSRGLPFFVSFSLNTVSFYKKTKDTNA